MSNRILKESICVSDSIESLTWFEEVLFYRLIVNCDDFGRFDGRVNVIKNRLFPLKENLTAKAVKDGINKLASVGLVTLYVFEGKPYLHLPTWNVHQNIRAKKSKFPAPPKPEECVNESECICKQMNADEFRCKQMQANVPVIQSESESKSESESESESECKPAEPSAHPEKKSAFGEFGWVKLTQKEHSGLLRDLGEAELNRCIAYVDESAQATSNKNGWKDWNLVLRKCHRDGWGLRQKSYEKPKPVYGCGELGQAELEAIRRAIRESGNGT